MSTNPDSIQSVLVIDDSAVQRQHGVDLCRELGVTTVHEASNGREALALLDSLSPPPSLLIVDLEMPTMDGPELLSQLRRRSIDIPVIVVSSRERALIHSVRHMGAALGLRVLGAAQKPLTRDELAKLFASWKGSESPATPASGRASLDAAAVRAALEGGQFCVHYQPQLEIKTGRIRGVEALARWQHPTLGLILPDAFISLAEKEGLIRQLTMQVMSQAMAQAAAWAAEDINLSMAINVSPTLLDHPDLVDQVVSLQQAYGLRAESIILEVTESSLLRDVAVALGVLTRLRLRGFGLSLDDYGTGFASMQQLAQIPFTELKIDRAFVHGVCEAHALQVMLGSAIEMAQELGLVTVAEGVELPGELNWLQVYGCTFAQGWLISKAKSAQDFTAWLRARGER